MSGMLDWVRRWSSPSLRPLHVVQDRPSWERFLASSSAQKSERFDRELIARHADQREWTFPGYSRPAGQAVEFIVDLLWGGREEDGVCIPNLRERLVCPVTQLNNRQRLIATLAREAIERARQPLDVYFMEEITPIFAWSRATIRNIRSLAGSEYLGPDHPPGAVVNGLHHEDIHRLSFSDGSLDLIVSNEVFEHIPSPRQAFRECRRVLRRGGEMIMTTPFFPSHDASVCRARIGEAGVEHLHPPVYHGNPVSEEGSLVFHDFGWDILDMSREAGFSGNRLEIYHAPAFGHLTMLSVFRFAA